MVDQIHWLKTTSKGTISPGHGYYLQHAKEVSQHRKPQACA